MTGKLPEVAVRPLVAARSAKKSPFMPGVASAAANGLPGSKLARAIKRRVFSEMGLLVQEVGIVPRGRLIKTTSGKISRGENLRRYRKHREWEA